MVYGRLVLVLERGKFHTLVQESLAPYKGDDSSITFHETTHRYYTITFHKGSGSAGLDLVGTDSVWGMILQC